MTGQRYFPKLSGGAADELEMSGRAGRGGLCRTWWWFGGLRLDGRWRSGGGCGFMASGHDRRNGPKRLIIVGAGLFYRLLPPQKLFKPAQYIFRVMIPIL